jgi:DNA-binding HxlR family transcriptional regulator
MSGPRYPQFCALARAAELVGERWTLLIVRELLLGPRRFSDLRERLDGISPSVLAERLGRAEAEGLVRRAQLPPPAASTVYELTRDGEALRPVVHALIRWGGRRLGPPRRGDRREPEWVRLALEALARRGPSPARRLRLRLREGGREALVRVTGGPAGTTVAADDGAAEATLTSDVPTVLALATGRLPLREALAAGRASAEGDLAALEDLAALFEPPPLSPPAPPAAPARRSSRRTTRSGRPRR